MEIEATPEGEVTPEVVEEEAPVVEGGGEVEEPIEAAPEGEAGEPEPYTPNFEYKVKDQTLEFDEWARPLVTNAEVEAKLRETFEKAHGIEDIKTQRQSLRDELSGQKEWRQTMEGSLEQLNTYLNNKDFGSFMKALKIPEELVVGYAVNKLKYQEMSPEQRQVYDAQQAEHQRLSHLEVQNRELVRQQQEIVQRQQANELDAELSKPDISQVAQTYDARVGKPGAFREEVIRRGAYYENLHNQTITPQQAVSEVIGLIGGIQSPGTQAGTQQPQPQAGPQVVQQKKPVLPNVQGQTGATGVRKQPKSIDDLRKLQQQYASQA